MRSSRPTDCHLPLRQAWQPAKHRGAILRIVVRHNLPHWLVVCDHTHGWWLDAGWIGLPLTFDLVAILHALADMGGFIVYRMRLPGSFAPSRCASLCPAWANTSMQLWRFGLRQKYPFGLASARASSSSKAPEITSANR